MLYNFNASMAILPEYTDILQNIIIFVPEIVVILTLLIVFILELIEENSILLPFVSVGGLSIASIALIIAWIYPVSTNHFPNYEVNGLTTTFQCILTISSAFSILIAQEYIQRCGMALGEFVIFILTATIGALFLCGANDLITFFVSIECLSLSSYLLASYSKKDIRSNEAAMKYLLMGGASSTILAYGFSWLYGLSGGELELTNLVLGISNHLSEPLILWISLICIIVGISFKIAAVPFHQWTPDVYEGSPTPIVAFFSVGSKAAALVFAIRILNIIYPGFQNEWQPIISLLSILTMIIGNLIAVTQTSIKRLLAYSSISQAGYLMIGIIYGQHTGFTPIILYMLIYLFMNLGAFACIILIGLRTGTDQIRDYTGLYFQDPVLTVCLSICLLSLAGMPPFAGFFGKLYLFWYAWNSGLYVLVYIGLITSVISLYYYLRVIKLMITKEMQETSIYIRTYSETQFSLIPHSPLEFSIAICVFFSTVLGLFFNPIIALTKERLLVGILF